MLNPMRATGYSNIRFWSRLRTQAIGALLVAVILPTILAMLVFPGSANFELLQLTAAGNACAVLLTLYLVRNMVVYPGISGAFFVLPAAFIGFAATFAVFLLLRLDYSRALLISGGLGTLIWLYIVQLMIEGGPPLRVGVVPFGEVASLRDVRHFRVHWLEAPQRDGRYDLLVADFNSNLSNEWEAFLADCALQGVPVFHVKQLRESVTGRVEIEHLSENSFGSLVPFLAYLRLRRLIDFGTAVVAGVVLAPLFAIVAIWIKLDSAGPVLFRQVRIGYRGQPFRVAKFRTMAHRPTSEDALEGAITKDNDVRITRVGRFLRRTRIDELPQIFNILVGEMSWIGPRPEAEVLSKWYEAELPFYCYRHIVPPGVTGWAQVNQGHVADLAQVNSKLHYDFYYIKNFSPWLDALIVAKTIQIVITGYGSK